MDAINSKALSRFIVVFILITFYLNPLQAFKSDDYLKVEDDIVRIQYTVLDKELKSYRSFFGGRSGEISFELIELRNLDSDEAILGVEINIHTHETEQTSSSIAFSSVGRMWGVSSGATYRNIQRSGYIFLDENDLEIIIDFLNGIIGEIGRRQDYFTLYTISIRQQFEFGMLYDVDSANINKWAFTFSADNSTYRLEYNEGISVLRALSRFRGYIIENQPQ